MNGVGYEWDEAKATANLQLHGVAFDRVRGFDWPTALVARDERRDYGEDRFVALGMIGARCHVLVFTRRGETCRVISLRRTNLRERKQYEKA